MNLKPLMCAVIVVSGSGGAKESHDSDGTAATTNADVTEKTTVTATIENVKARTSRVDMQTR